MSNININGNIQVKRGNTETSSYIPKDGEIIYDTNINNIKVGNGTSKASSLSFIGNSNSSINISDQICLDITAYSNIIHTASINDNNNSYEYIGKGIFFGVYAHYCSLTLDGTLICKDTSTRFSSGARGVLQENLYVGRHVFGLPNNYNNDNFSFINHPIPMIIGDNDYSTSAHVFMTIQHPILFESSLKIDLLDMDRSITAYIWYLPLE